MDARRRWVPACIVALTAAVSACGSLTYNEGDNDDQPPPNECADIDHRPERCED